MHKLIRKIFMCFLAQYIFSKCRGSFCRSEYGCQKESRDFARRCNGSQPIARFTNPIGVNTRKNTIARMMRLETYAITSASFIHPLRGITSRRGAKAPDTTSAEPINVRTTPAISNFPRYHHQRRSASNTPPTSTPNSRSALLTRDKCVHRSVLLLELTGNPVISNLQPILE